MTLSEQDLNYIWHPYTHQKNRVPAIPILKGTGSLLVDENGNEYIDATSSWWVNIHGHAHPYIARKLYEQALKLEHVIFTGFTHEPAIRLASRLLEILPANFSKIFYSDNGSTATEVAIKMALQYWKNHGRNKSKIIAFNASYHGDTFGAMSISNRSLFNAAFEDKLFEVLFIDPPTANNIEQITNALSPHHDIACFIYEPLLQGAGGMLMHNAALMNELLAFLKSKEIICIADEVLTGFYRTGTLFASEQIEIKPDIICLSKGLTGGTMALGVTAATSHIFEAFISDDKTNTFYHGHSFTANPLACTAANASLDLLEHNDCIQNISMIKKSQEEFIDSLAKSVTRLSTKNHRVCGTIAAFEIVTEGADSYLNNLGPVFTEYCIRNGVYLRPLGNTVYIMPPYCITDAELTTIYGVIISFLNQV